MSKVLHIKVTLIYNGKEYVFIDDHSGFDYKGVEIKNPFWWEEGNGGCDCNRSLFIRRHCDKEFPRMKCGHTIDLKSLEFIGDWEAENYGEESR